MSSLADFLLAQESEYLDDDDIVSAPVATLEAELESLRKEAQDLQASFAPRKPISIVKETSQGGASNGEAEKPQQEPSLNDDFFAELPSVQVHRRTRAGGRKQLEMELFEMKQELGFLSEVLEAEDSPSQKEENREDLYDIFRCESSFTISNLMCCAHEIISSTFSILYS